MPQEYLRPGDGQGTWKDEGLRMFSTVRRHRLRRQLQSVVAAGTVGRTQQFLLQDQQVPPERPAAQKTGAVERERVEPDVDRHETEYIEIERLHS